MTKKQWQHVSWGTYTFLILQIGVFLAMTFAGLQQSMGLSGSENPYILMQFGAISVNSILYAHQWWRFITPIFVHIGLTHIIINSVTLYYIGRYVEAYLGHARFIIIYLLSGIMGNILSVSFASTASLSAGASTSLFGLFAAIFVLGNKAPYIADLKVMSQSMGLFIVMNLIFNIFMPTIDILGHFGGVIGGILSIFIVSKTTWPNFSKRSQVLALISYVIICAGCLFYLFF